MKSHFTMFLYTMRCFNVAAMVTLAIWHGYVFYLNQALQNGAPARVFEHIDSQPTNTATPSNPLNHSFI